ncbi:tyrosine protein kinase [Paenibacillus darwinianus]|nr:tyrosine protein kinase [Paenibacillus darwinianus]EXX88944.1 tyrosine protein kinase [Paenibacillus darwinianus]
MRSFQQPLESGGAFPGISDPFAFGSGAGPDSGLFGGGGPGIAGFQPGQNLPGFFPGAPQAFQSAAPLAKTGFSLGNLGNLNDLKGMIDRLGGIDGIVATVQKVQKVVSSMQQMAPMFKLIAGSIGKKKSAAVASDDESVPPKRRRRRRRSSSTTRRPGGKKRR